MMTQHDPTRNDDAPKNKTACFAITVVEEDAIALVRLHRQVTRSELLRTTLIADVVAEAGRIREALAAVPAVRSA